MGRTRKVRFRVLKDLPDELGRSVDEDLVPTLKLALHLSSLTSRTMSLKNI